MWSFHVLCGIDALLASPDDASRDAWIAATDNSVSLAAIHAALHSPEYLAWSLAKGSTTAKDLS